MSIHHDLHISKHGAELAAINPGSLADYAANDRPVARLETVTRPTYTPRDALVGSAGEAKVVHPTAVVCSVLRRMGATYHAKADFGTDIRCGALARSCVS
jgi:hypothetical protein